MRSSRILPFAAIWEYARVDDETLAEILGHSLKWVQRHRGHGLSVTLEEGERCAEALGVHPLLLWPIEYRAACFAEGSDA